MRLELKQIRGTSRKDPSSWYFERGRRTLGRSADCDWQVADDTRRISKLHCTILREQDGYFLRDESANGTKVDDRLIFEGESARLNNRSSIAFGEFTFLVVISGERDLDMDDPADNLTLSDENLTITAILTDVSPGGSSANGILPGRVADEWHAAIGADRTAGADTRSLGQLSPRPNPVETSWGTSPGPLGLQPMLPSDWNKDFDYGNRLEHGGATIVSVSMTRSTSKNGDSETSPAAMAEPMQDKEPLAKDQNASLHSRIESLLGRCEDSVAEAFAVLGVEGAPPETSTSAATHEEAFRRRLERLAERQHALAEAINLALDEASRTLDPRIIESQIDAASHGPPWWRARLYWQAYRQRLRDGEKDLSLRDHFRKIILEAVGSASNKRAVHSE